MSKNEPVGNGTGKKTSIFSGLFGGNRSEEKVGGKLGNEMQRVKALMDALCVESSSQVGGDVTFFAEHGLEKLEETIGKNDFTKVKKAFGIGYKAPHKSVGKPGEINLLLARLRTIENSMYYIRGNNKIIEAFAEKLLGAPEGMDEITRAKLVIVYYRIFFSNEQFVEDFLNIQNPLNGEWKIDYSEFQALKNNPKVIGPEEIAILNRNKVAYVEKGVFYDAILFEIAKLGKSEQKEVLEFAELEYDRDKEMFRSVNKCMLSPTFGKIRALKKKISTPRSFCILETFADRQYVDERLDPVSLYHLYKYFNTVNDWKERAEKETRKIRTFVGSKFEDVDQEYYKVLGNLCVADDMEAERWCHTLRYLAWVDHVMVTEIDGTGQLLPEPKTYHMGLFWGAMSFAYTMGYIGRWSTIAQDLDTIENIIALEGSHDILIDYKNTKITFEEAMEKLAISEEYAREHLYKYPSAEDIARQIAEVEAQISARDAGGSETTTISQSAEETVGEPEANEEVSEANEANESTSEILVEKQPDVEVSVFKYAADDGSDFEVHVPHVGASEVKKFKLASMGKVTDTFPEINGVDGYEAYMIIESLIRYALTNGYVEYSDEVAMDVLVNIFVPYYKDEVMDFITEYDDYDGFEDECGIPEEFAEYFFDLKTVDIKLIEDRLMQLKTNRYADKKKNAYKAHSGLIRLYCYLVNNSVSCGPKMKAPKRNSSLKTKNLEKLI